MVLTRHVLLLCCALSSGSSSDQFQTLQVPNTGNGIPVSKIQFPSSPHSSPTAHVVPVGISTGSINKPLPFFYYIPNNLHKHTCALNDYSTSGHIKNKHVGSFTFAFWPPEKSSSPEKFVEIVNSRTPNAGQSSRLDRKTHSSSNHDVPHLREISKKNTMDRRPIAHQLKWDENSTGFNGETGFLGNPLFSSLPVPLNPTENRSKHLPNSTNPSIILNTRANPNNVDTYTGYNNLEIIKINPQNADPSQLRGRRGPPASSTPGAADITNQELYSKLRQHSNKTLATGKPMKKPPNRHQTPHFRSKRHTEISLPTPMPEPKPRVPDAPAPTTSDQAIAVEGNEIDHGRPKPAKKRRRGRTKGRRKKDMSLYIDQNEVQRLSGYPMEVYVIRDGRVLPYILDPNFDSRLPVIPPEVESIRFTWHAGASRRRYHIDRLVSADTAVMGHPLLTIPPRGRVPRAPREFEIRLPCAANTTGTTAFTVRLKIKTRHGTRLPGTPLAVRLRKRCAPIDPGRGGRCPHGLLGANCTEALCFPHCLNGGLCAHPGPRCVCPPGYQGASCEGGLCGQRCEHGGKCVQKDTCKCARGYYGHTCQFSKCVVPCVNGGVCRGVNRCRCPPGYGGAHCEVATGRCRGGAEGPRCRGRGARQRRRRVRVWV